MKPLCSIAVGLVLTVAAAAQQASPVAGKWELRFMNLPKALFVVDLKVDGGTITGILAGNDSTLRIDGQFIGTKLTFDTFDKSDNLNASYTGALRDGALSGTADGLEAGIVHRSSWTATRPKS